MLHPRVAVATVLIMLLVAAQPALARHCSTFTTSTTSDAQVVSAAGSNYVAIDTCLSKCGVWVYEETNGIAGLQRGDENRDDTCHGIITADRVVL